MKYLVDEVQARKMDQYTILKVGIPSLVLMEKAAMALASVMKERITPRDRIITLCGMGNNGGDGVACARILKEHGYSVAIYLLGDEKRASESMKQQLQIARNVGVRIVTTIDWREYSVAIDALFGIGLSKPIQGEYFKCIEGLNRAGCFVYSVDVPSGIEAGNGRVLGIAVNADVTVTFGVHKIGLCLFPGCEYAGEVVVADIGYPLVALEEVKPNCVYYEPSDVAKMLPRRKSYSNKGSYGKVLVIAGSRNMSGACFLSAKAAYRSGAGLVKVLTVEENRSIMQAELPEAILSTYNPQNLKNKLDIDAIQKEIEWADSIVIGPGMQVTSYTAQMLALVLSNAQVPVVVDADALNVMAMDEYRDKLAKGEQVILTPHMKEMSRLTGQPVAGIADGILEFAKTFAKADGRVLVLKDARSVVTDGERSFINLSGNHGMATGGSGDVLTGILAGLLAQGMPRLEAASLGVYLHGLAGDCVAGQKNAYSLMAGDLVEALSEVMR